MYNPPLFAEDRIDVLRSFIRDHPFASLVSCGPDGPEATHLPMVLHVDTAAKDLLRCHVARANPHWQIVARSPAVLVIFQGPEHYITPTWYPSTEEHGKVVPTWNYVAVHVRGRARIFEQPAELLPHLRALTDQSEGTRDPRWSVDDAPPEYVEALSKGIVGIEISIDTMQGKWKVSQNRAPSDRLGVVAGLEALSSPASQEMAQLVKQRAPK